MSNIINFTVDVIGEDQEIDGTSIAKVIMDAIQTLYPKSYTLIEQLPPKIHTIPSKL